MNKNIFYIAIVATLLIMAWLLFGNSFASGKFTDSASGDYQKIVLSIKNGNYYPNEIKVTIGKPVRVYLDDSVRGCYRSFSIPSFGVQQYLASSKDYIEFTPNKAGVYGFRCGMGMGRGTLVAI